MVYTAQTQTIYNCFMNELVITITLSITIVSLREIFSSGLAILLTNQQNFKKRKNWQPLEKVFLQFQFKYAKQFQMNFQFKILEKRFEYVNKNNVPDMYMSTDILSLTFCLNLRAREPLKNLGRHISSNTQMRFETLVTM